jgi:RNA ligase (TIGR02306 family)
MRKLASIQKIQYVSPIDGAEFIERVGVLGWEVVNRKGFSPEDLCVYIEIDSVVPDVPAFHFLKGSGRWQRIRTKRLRGVLSQGLVMPISILTDFNYSGSLDIGTDVTDVIGIVKYEPQIYLIKTHGAGYWPSYIPKTDEPCVQSNPGVLKEMEGIKCYISVKLDGTSCTYIHKDEDDVVCSRNWALLPDDASVYSEVAKTIDIFAKLKQKGNFAVQGELVGPGIQGNKLGLKDKGFFAFNVFDIDEKRYLDFEEFVNFCKSIDLPTVPIEMSDVVFCFSKEELLRMADGKYDGTNSAREGIVIRPMKEVYSPCLKGRLSFKVISNDFLLKNKE